MTKLSKKWNSELIPSQAGRRVLITGANSGIGFETALELARSGAEIILPARSMPKALDAIQRIRQRVPAAQVVPAVLDLASLASVRELAAWFCREFAGQSLDLLINNAGVMAVPQRELTVDGFERQFATNFLGPFALTARLYASMIPRKGTRIVIVSSSATKWAKLDFDNLQSQHEYKPMFQAYGQSKLADSLFAFELHRRLTAVNSPIIVTSAHPGYAITNLQTSGPGEQKGLVGLLSAILKPVLSHDATHGALPTLFAATSPDAAAGGYYGPDGLFELKGYPVAVAVPALARDTAVAARLWKEAERLTDTVFSL
jgi:NAD(P)-dependent dehydrogenase (short-subunit alcohol dehydrogenase family)